MVKIDAWRQDGKFLAAPAGKDIGFSYIVLDHDHQFSEYRITRRSSQPVVDCPEIVDIENNQG